MSRNRPSGPGTRVYIRATANPGGVGHGWVKARFISPAPAGTRMVQLVKVKAPEGKEITRRRTRIFIPSTVFDNPALLENDPATSAHWPRCRRPRSRRCSTETGTAFRDRCSPSGGTTRTTMKTSGGPTSSSRSPSRSNWKIWRGYDFGFSKPFSVGWYAADERGRLYRIKELYGCTGTPNEGLRKDRWSRHG